MSPTAPKPVVNVAAAALTRADGRVLLAERPNHKLSGGHWEFPGGKVDAGENERQALVREVAEEVGIVIDAAAPWLVYDHEYPDKIVRLHIYKVSSWHGTPRGQERQRISWEDPNALAVAPLMHAYSRALDALRLPTVIAVAYADSCGRSEFLAQTERALRSGLGVIVLRERTMLPAQFTQFARQVSDLAHRYGAKVLVEAGKAHAGHSTADGAHVCCCKLPEMTTAPAGAIWSASCKTPHDLDLAAARGATFATVPPPGAEDGTAIDWDRFSAMIKRSAAPVFASGGLAPEHLDHALHAGAHGIALPLSAW